MAQNINQFAQAAVQGMLDLQFNPAIVSAEIDVSSAGGLVAGQAVKIVDSAGGVPKVVECADDSDDVFGFIRYDIKTQVYDAFSVCELAAMRDNCMYMTAGAAVARNAKVMIVVASSKVVTATSGNMIVGRAFDKASADGDLIRVIIDLPGVLA
jgi:hypothetical protein